MLVAMPSAEELRQLRGKQATLRLNDGGEVTGTVVGTLEAADGLVVVIDRSDRPGSRFTCNYQAIAGYTTSP